MSSASATIAAKRGTATGAAPKARADAARNRERILNAAREAFVVHGADASLDEIARTAGVGNATLYRHFPDRDTLIHGVMHFVTERIANRAEEALAQEDDPFEALRSYVFGAAAERIGALCPMLSGRFDPSDPECLAARVKVEKLTKDLIRRAQRAGAVRDDIDVGDIMITLSQLTRPLPGVGCQGIERFVERHVQLFLDGLRAPAKSELPGHAATLEELRQEN
ncbi:MULTISPECIES: TetR/AcrR family transcriptional regulator [unclassified Streptomyces]|uniref:TetR/AcrR family transcriptional regulator n=1 Tax=unclassified Streptomyces TaxID=2593676 RepID=UPI002DDB1AC8|nr:MULTISPECIES: TetR/AcrR family transcriptional regulator [unclassified Streptomyces]WSB78583.1 TetR/AcrR family transcriptional regulator [Streptomyces sp. NBC_01775]WSS13224.1 TetR/AcrR family transcriptional regulator [Streptomyces sp. NBC_01186]WSS42011.1 TetR/AcrR family transcriptional regulator [Streptomyces sp. NBC_01187]